MGEYAFGRAEQFRSAGMMGGEGDDNGGGVGASHALHDRRSAADGRTLEAEEAEHVAEEAFDAAALGLWSGIVKLSGSG